MSSEVSEPKEGGAKLFNLRYDINISDLLLIAGIILIAAGIYIVYRPAAIIFVGISLIVLAFLLTPKQPESKEGR